VSVLRIALAQLNPTVGDLSGNLKACIEMYDRAVAEGCDLVAFGELSITGYPPEDLVLKPGFVADNLAALHTFASHTGQCAAVIGFVDREADDPHILRNAAALCSGGQVVGIYHKRELPNYAVFDEARYFRPGSATGPIDIYEVGGVPIGITICEDIWQPEGPLGRIVAAGARVNININGSPYEVGKAARREELVTARAREHQCPIVYVNQVGGQDELVFDGGSMVVDAAGNLVARAPQFATDLMIVDLDLADPDLLGADHDQSLITPALSADAELYEALVVGTRDYCHKNGFSDVVIGLSGGIDSTLVACVAVDALGADHVHGVSMPSRYSSDHSRTDARALADNLGIDFSTVSIEPAFSAYLEMLAESFEGRTPGLTYENLQSRCRGQVLMAMSNEFGYMVLTTGNKSELAVGYFTIYGDSVGGYAVIKDLLKTRVYDLCRFVNQRAGWDVIPPDVITKPPSAELRPDQRDDQSLPPYEVLDPVLELYVDRDRTAAEIIDLGHEPEMVRRITRLVDIAEYKRRQTPPGVRVTAKGFGKDRRMPITSGYRG
jgi:NAD+ synthase (glutamine-hydrolysing)